jgi:hypothetical protein
LREDREKRNQGAVLKRNQWTTKNWPVAVLTQESQKKNQFETKKKLALALICTEKPNKNQIVGNSYCALESTTGEKF